MNNWCKKHNQSSQSSVKRPDRNQILFMLVYSASKSYRLFDCFLFFFTSLLVFFSHSGLGRRLKVQQDVSENFIVI